MKNLSKILLASLFLIGLSTVTAMEKNYEHPFDDLPLELSTEMSHADVIVIAPDSNATALSSVLAAAEEFGVKVVIVGVGDNHNETATELEKVLQFKISETMLEPQSKVYLMPRSKFIEPPRFNYKK
ncbi:hypothetical protein LCGC14_1807390 [marine sediment metagenome]|uniref:Uncharacterized protein n=2 Tax=root TaxID=1 RepID=A0A831VQN8_9FLAO|nr:hypothetical protein [Pricia antarctica]